MASGRRAEQRRGVRALYVLFFCLLYVGMAASQDSGSSSAGATTTGPSTTTPPPTTTTTPPTSTEASTPPPDTTEAATPPPESTQTATPPPDTTESPPASTEDATPPPETTEDATPPPDTTEGATPPPATTEAATPPPETTEDPTSPPDATEAATPPPTTTKSATSPPSKTTEAPATISPTPSTSSLATTSPTAAPSPTEPASTTQAPVVERYNSSTLPPGVDSSLLDGAELVTVEVTETTQEDGTSTYSYVVITRTGETLQSIALSPSTTTPASGGSLSDANNSTTTSSSVGIGTIAGIIVGSVVFILVLFGFFIGRRRRIKKRPSDVSSNDVLDSPVVGKQVWLLEQGQSLAETEYAEMTRTTANSRSTGSSMPHSSLHRSTLWEDPVILASRIPVDRIELGALIGRGAFGEVYRGRYRGQSVAIKMLVPEKRKDMAHIQAFLSEVRLIATMEHPHIVPFVGVAWESLGDMCCVTEYMTGGDLRTLLKEYLDDGIPQGMDAIKMQIAYQVAYALTYLHSLDPVVLHRDLKSRNILLTESLHAKITDFGASRIRSDATMTSNVGSALWMAPEVMMGGHYGEKADVFSLGVVISELDTHELPYSHAKEESSSSGRSLPDAAVLQMVSMGKLRVRLSSFMHPDMARIVTRCVSVEPQERPTAAELLYYLQVAIRNRQY